MFNNYFRNKTIKPSFSSDYFKFSPRSPNLGRTKGENLTTLGRQMKEYKQRVIKPVNRFKPLENSFIKKRFKYTI